MRRRQSIRWQQIVDAPRDGTVIIAKNPNDRSNPYPYRTRFIDGRWIMLTYGGATTEVTVEPTLWREVPRTGEPTTPHRIGPGGPNR